MPAKKDDPENPAKRQSAHYITKVQQLGRSNPDLPDDEVDRQALEANDLAVYGFDAKKDRRGAYIQQGIGAPGRETPNHFSAILRYQGPVEHQKALREIWGRDPKHAERIGLPRPEKEKVA